MAEYDGHTLELRGNKIAMEPEEAGKLMLAIAAFFNKDVPPVVDPTPVIFESTYIAGYSRFGGQYDEECDSLEEALDFLIDGANDEQLSFSGKGYIICPDGKVIKGEEFIEMINKREETRG